MKFETRNNTDVGSAPRIVPVTCGEPHRFTLPVKVLPAKTKNSPSQRGFFAPRPEREVHTTQIRTMKKTLILIAVALSLGAITTFAEDAQVSPPDGPRLGGRPGGPGGPGMRPPMPVLEALDVNHDGVIDATEIANAVAALKTLDKNGDGQLTREELMPARPEGFAGRGDGRGPGEGRGPGRGRSDGDRQRPPVE